MRTGAFFDLDGTLLRGESQRLLLGYLLRRGRVSFLRLAPLVFGMAAYRAGILNDPAPLRNRAVRVLAGRTEAEVGALLKDFFRDQIARRLDGDIVSRLRRHQARGEPVLILSAAIEPLVHLAGAFLDARGEAGTRLETGNGVFTGRISGAPPWGSAKATRLRELCAEHGLSADNSWAYADHGSDIPFLAGVGHPVAVNPDRVLLREAHSRGWEILRTPSSFAGA